MAIPNDYHVVVVDLKDCFLLFIYNLRIHPNLLSVFPLLISESCTKGVGGLCCPPMALCQGGGVGGQRPQLCVIHWLNCILVVDWGVGAGAGCDLHAGLQALYEEMQQSGLVVAPRKMQTVTVFPFRCLGCWLLQIRVRPQEVILKTRSPLHS